MNVGLIAHGRPGGPELGNDGLRQAGWCLQTNRVYAACYRHLTGREHHRLTPTQAQTAVAGAILRQLYAVVVHQQAWDPAIAAHGTKALEEVTAA